MLGLKISVRSNKQLSALRPSLFPASVGSPCAETLTYVPARPHALTHSHSHILSHTNASTLRNPGPCMPILSSWTSLGLTCGASMTGGFDFMSVHVCVRVWVFACAKWACVYVGMCE
jgi:hypothetical protein